MTCTKNWTDSSLFQVHFDVCWSLFAVKCVRCGKDTNWLLTHTYPSECTIPKSWFANSSIAPMFRWDHFVTGYLCFTAWRGWMFFFFIRQALSAMVITNGQTPEILDLACGISQENCTEVYSLNEIQGFQNECILLLISDWQSLSRSIEVQPLPAQETVVLSPVWVRVLCCSSCICSFFHVFF